MVQEEIYHHTQIDWLSKGKELSFCELETTPVFHIGLKQFIDDQALR